MYVSSGKYLCKYMSPEDVWKAMEKDRENYFFIDVQSRGEYPNLCNKRCLKEMNITLKMEAGDEEILKNNTVDFISFSYYSSRLTSADPEVNKTTEGNAICNIKKSIFKS